MAERKEQMVNRKERTSTSGCHATDNTHHRVTRKKTEGKYPIQKRETYDKKERKRQKEKNQWRRAKSPTSIRRHQYVYVVYCLFLFSHLQYAI